jgi:hypothetical protein
MANKRAQARREDAGSGGAPSSGSRTSTHDVDAVLLDLLENPAVPAKVRLDAAITAGATDVVQSFLQDPDPALRLRAAKHLGVPPSPPPITPTAVLIVTDEFDRYPPEKRGTWFAEPNGMRALVVTREVMDRAEEINAQAGREMDAIIERRQTEEVARQADLYVDEPHAD